ncbi:MAG: SMC-Scp complex subunit ScpB [Clostridiales bacterium]|nr:SMC-Scp complex subunit ScpB [Clostridiales bacterium]MDD7123111.1 SMC-Scp complex subunit ScpB [Clostridiales bacterium]MDY5469424.1 SMC-Scp complex subunit ScpB [Eubacteriales bacterium]
MTELAKIIEAILFVSGEPVQLGAVARALEVTELEVSAAADELASDYDYNRRGICLKRFGSHIQLSTRPDYAPQIEKLLQPIQKQSLSQAALETLAVVAYKQPVTRLDIEAVRGVKCDYSVQSLMNKGLIEEVGRKETLGRPILYGTTDAFLSHFGLTSLEDLPQPPESQQDSPAEPLVT